MTWKLLLDIGPKLPQSCSNFSCALDVCLRFALDPRFRGMNGMGERAKNRSSPRTRDPDSNRLDPAFAGMNANQSSPSKKKPGSINPYASARWRFDWSAAREVMVETVSSVRRLASAIAFDALLAKVCAAFCMRRPNSLV